MIPESLVRTIADLEFGLQNKLFAEFGSIEPAIRGYRAKDGKVTTVNKLDFEGDFRTGHKSLVDKMLKKYPVVSSVMEVYETDSRTNQRTEAVMINIHTGGKLWILRCGIERTPVCKLVKGELVVPKIALGRMVEDRPVPSNARAITKEVRALLVGNNVRWKELLANKMAQLTELLGDIKPFTDALYAADTPSDKLHATTAMLEELMTVTNSPASTQGGDVLEVLLGFDVWLDQEQEEERDVDMADVISTAHARVSEEWQGVGIDVKSDPEGELAIFNSFIPLSVAHSLKTMTETWGSPVEELSGAKTFAGGSREWFAQSFDRDYHEYMAHPLGKLIRLTLPVSVSIHIPNRRLPMFRLLVAHEADPAITSAIEQAAGPMRRAVESTLADFGLKGSFGGVGRLYDQLRTKHLAVTAHCIQDLLSLAASTSAHRGESTAVQDMHAFVGAATFTKPFQHEKVLLSILAGGNVCLPLALQRPTYWNLADYKEMVLELLRESGVTLIAAAVGITNAQEHPLDSFGAPMYLDGNGSWFSPTNVSVPHAIGVLQTMSWDFYASEDSSDTDVLSLPAPHMIQRLGAASVMQRHFSPEVYRIVKDALSSDVRSIEQCWDAARNKHVGLDKLAKTHDFAVFPPEIVGLSLQLQWSRSPTLTVRSTLTERLRHTDLSNKLHTSVVNTPFALQYVHFSANDPVAEIRLTNGEKDYHVVLSGAFVRRESTPDGRNLEVRLVWKNPDEPLHTLISTVRLKLRDGGQTVAQCIAEATQNDVYESDDVRDSELAALDELFKVLFYMASKQARLIKKDDRGSVLKDLGRKSVDQQQKMLTRSRALYDHILVGPEQAFEGETSMDGITRRQTKVTIRRGHLHGYWRGAGRTEYVVHLLDPIVVNKRLLGDGEEPPDPKNYTLH